MSTTRPHEFDVAVIGGGPAGATTACRLARAGRRVILLERDRFPRFHVGESLLATVNDVLEEIGAADLVRARGFPVKWGATFGTGDGTFERFADFSVAPEVRTPQTWQVPRAEFDELLLRHAAASGADVREGHRVLDVAFDGDGATVAFRDAADCPSEVRVAAVVDASGRVGLLARKLDLRVDEPGLDNIAVFAHYSGVPRAEGRRAGEIRIVAREDLGWFWLIPISEALMSVGVVLPRAAYDALPRMAPEALLEHTIRETPGVARLMSAARREWPVRVEKDFSFGARAYAGTASWSWAMPAHSSTRSSRRAWPSRSNPAWRPGAHSMPRSDPVTSPRAPSRSSIAGSGSATGRSGASSSPSTRRAFASCSSRPCPHARSSAP